MSDENQTITCASCGHENAPYVDKCILCDALLPRRVKEVEGRVSHKMRKHLGPLPESDLLADKKKSKRDSPKVLICEECGATNRAGTLMCHNCGARVEVPSVEDEQSAFASLKDIEEAMAMDDQDTQSVYEPVLDINQRVETPAIMSPKMLEDPNADIPDGCMKFTSWMILNLEILGYHTPIVVRPLEDKPLLIGRRHESLPVQPQIDLTPYLQEKHGVSRRHAVLRMRGSRLELQDLNSTNGTSINGVRFSPKESHQLRHQDIIQVGQVQIQVSFGQRVRSATFGNTEQL